MRESRPPEVVINEPEKLVEFYRNVFGWNVLDIDLSTGSWAIYQRHPSTGSEKKHIDLRRVIDKPTSYLGSFPVEDIGEITTRVIENGGKIYIEAGEGETDIVVTSNSSLQRFFCDPEGNMFGATQLD